MRRPIVALVFAAAAAFSSWNPLAAPFGLVVGVAAVVLAARALGAPRGRWISRAALGLAVLAVGGSAVVLAMTAGVGRGPGGADVVEAPTAAEVRRTLDDAAAATREPRDRARGELDQVVKDGSDATREAAKKPNDRP